jgi:hypothetical protein
MADTHKRGDSFSRLITLPVSIADGHFVGWDMVSQVRNSTGGLLASLTCEWVDPDLTREIRLTCIDTTSWPLGPASLDVQFTRVSDGWVTSTSTYDFEVTHDVTKP